MQPSSDELLTSVISVGGGPLHAPVQHGDALCCFTCTSVHWFPTGCSSSQQISSFVAVSSLRRTGPANRDPYCSLLQYTAVTGTYNHILRSFRRESFLVAPHFLNKSTEKRTGAMASTSKAGIQVAAARLQGMPTDKRCPKVG